MLWYIELHYYRWPWLTSKGVSNNLIAQCFWSCLCLLNVLHWCLCYCWKVVCGMFAGRLSLQVCLVITLFAQCTLLLTWLHVHLILLQLTWCANNCLLISVEFFRYFDKKQVMKDVKLCNVAFWMLYLLPMLCYWWSTVMQLCLHDISCVVDIFTLHYHAVTLLVALCTIFVVTCDFIVFEVNSRHYCWVSMASCWWCRHLDLLEKKWSDMTINVKI